ncbi:Ger(x)C family spore germination protein [Desmospora activa]|uniref:Spore germination protein KC n=1 Tax=Desmospora activa DSM 45169 TaxID=1121389 RepID=A0A2T4Z890_9BACL|nr:Ger(x)C family spore germination protein [Desmospora activa]PTM58109.1 spore germination protein KC [Desmospora activa DSM 45169]
MKWKRIGIVCLIVVIGFSTLTGCWNRREMNQLSIAGMLGVDKIGDEYIVSAQVINPGKVFLPEGGGTNQSPVITYIENGETLFEAFRKLTQKFPRKLYLPYVQVVIIGEDLAKEGITRPLDVLVRDHNVRPDLYLAVAKGTTALSLVKILTPLEEIPAIKLTRSMEISSQQWAETSKVKLYQLASDLVHPGIQTHLPGIEVIGNPDEGENTDTLNKSTLSTFLRIDGIAVFWDGKLKGWLNQRESEGFNFAKGEVNSTLVDVPCGEQGGKVGMEVVRTKSTIEGDMVRRRPRGRIAVEVEANVAEVECPIDLNDPSVIDDLVRQTEQAIAKKVNQSLERLQHQYHSDIFGFGVALQRSHPQQWRRWEKQWDRVFSQMPIKVDIDVEIRQLGSLGNTLERELKE